MYTPAFVEAVQRVREKLGKAKQEWVDLKQDASDLQEYSNAKITRVRKYLVVLQDKTRKLDASVRDADSRLLPLKKEKRKLFNDIMSLKGGSTWHNCAAVAWDAVASQPPRAACQREFFYVQARHSGRSSNPTYVHPLLGLEGDLDIGGCNFAGAWSTRCLAAVASLIARPLLPLQFMPVPASSTLLVES